MSNAKRLHYSYAEYLRMLADSDLKLEYGDGVVYAMAGGTLAHGQLGANLIAALRQALPSTCKVFSSDVKIRVEATDLAAFPDASVVCGDVQRASLDENALANPTLLVEVTSRSTEDYDRGDKLSQYKQLPSLKAVLFVSHRERRVTVVQRSDRGWDERDLRAGELVAVEALRLSVPVDIVYEGVVLESA